MWFHVVPCGSMWALGIGLARLPSLGWAALHFSGFKARAATQHQHQLGTQCNVSPPTPHPRRVPPAHADFRAAMCYLFKYVISSAKRVQP
eukprot:scaffold8095_cov75-Phaeocystis_antarctica.AAC.5